MKGKIFKYDQATQKMVPVADANMMPLGELKSEDGTTIGFGVIEVPADALAPIKFSKEERSNIRDVLRMAEDHSEKTMGRRECLRVQSEIARIRQRYEIDE